MTCIETHQGECRFSIRGTRCGLSPLWSFSTSVGGVEDFSYFDYVFGVANGVYGLKSFSMVI